MSLAPIPLPSVLLKSHARLVFHSGTLFQVNRGGFTDLGAHLLTKPGNVVGEDGRLVAGARDGDVAEP